MAQDCLDNEIRAVLLKSSLSKSIEKSDQNNLEAVCQSVTANFQTGGRSSRIHLQNTEHGNQSQLLAASQERQATMKQISGLNRSIHEDDAAVEPQRMQSNVKAAMSYQKAGKPDKKVLSRKSKAHQH